MDPIRVLRQNQWKIILGLVLGATVGVGAHFVLAIVYPRYSGAVVFELQAALDNPNAPMPKAAANDDVVDPASSDVVAVMRASVAAFASAVILSFFTRRSRLPSTFFMPRSSGA